jgi:hypothetical protein
MNYTKHLILKGGKQVNIDLKLPKKTSYFQLSDNNGYLWAAKDLSDLEEEPELLTFYKLSVVAQ